VPVGAGIFLINAVVGGGSTNGYKLAFLAGYQMIGAGIVMQLVALILSCIARDAYRAHAYSGFT
jgi:hypothetical protein